MDFEILSPTRKLKFCKLYLESDIFVFYLFIILITHNSFPGVSLPGAVKQESALSTR